MPYLPVQLFATRTVPAAATSLVPAAQIVTRIDSLTFSNSSAAPVTVTVNLVPLGSSPSVANQISTKVLNVAEDWTCYAASNKILNVGDVLSAVASVANAAVASGAGTQIS